MAEHGLITAYCIDEVHTVVDHGEAFPKFPEAINSIRALIETGRKKNPSHVTPLMAMSVTLTIPEQVRFNTLLGCLPDYVSWGPMDKRTVGKFNQMCGSPIHGIINDWDSDVGEE